MKHGTECELCMDSSETHKEKLKLSEEHIKNEMSFLNYETLTVLFPPFWKKEQHILHTVSTAMQNDTELTSY